MSRDGTSEKSNVKKLFAMFALAASAFFAAPQPVYAVDVICSPACRLQERREFELLYSEMLSDMENHFRAAYSSRYYWTSFIDDVTVIIAAHSWDARCNGGLQSPLGTRSASDPVATQIVSAQIALANMSNTLGATRTQAWFNGLKIVNGTLSNGNSFSAKVMTFAYANGTSTSVTVHRSGDSGSPYVGQHIGTQGNVEAATCPA